MTPVNLLRRSLFLGLWASATANAGLRTVQVVTVRNAQLIPLKLLRTQAEVTEFHSLWAHKQPNGKTSVQMQDWSYTIDIISGSSVARWMYQANGMTAKVDPKVQRVYQMKYPAQFNSLIGASRY
jgi:hypothetical protein